MSMASRFSKDLPAIGAALLLCALALLLRAGLPSLRRRLRLPLLPAGSAAIAAGVAIPALLVGLSSLHRPLLLPAGLFVLCVCLAGMRRVVRAHRLPDRTDAFCEVRMARRLAGLVASPSQAAVSRIVHRLALQAGATMADADELQAAALLHDVGRAGLPPALLDGAVPVDATQQRLLRRTPSVGARILGAHRSGLLARAAEIALCHQECWDGSGYPRGLSGLQIPLSARLLAVAAVFDLVLTASADAPAWQREQVLRRMGGEAGRLLDPRLTQILLDDLPAMTTLHGMALEFAAAIRQPAPALDAATPAFAPPAGARMFGLPAADGFA